MLVNGKTPITFNLNHTEQLIRYKCAVANKEIAESKDQLDDPDYKVNDCFLYVYDPIGDVERESVLEIIKDEITGLISGMRLQKEKSMLVCAKMNIPFNEEYTATQFYQMLKAKLKSLKRIEHLEQFKSVLQLPMDSLHVEYLVNKEIGKSIKMVNTQWTFADKVLGNTKAKVIEYFIKDEGMFSLLSDEYTKE
jgi:hypothetical protein